MGDDDEVEIDVAAAFGTDKVQAQRFAIYIPNKDQDGAPVEEDKWVEEAVRCRRRGDGHASGCGRLAQSRHRLADP